ncbi:MAG: DUF302 domain-containing protein [Acidimicrobiales bacterium]
MKAIETTLSATLNETEALVRSALKSEGFGVLTEMDVASVLKEKLGIERSPLKILGACNPDYANRALTIDPSVSLMLPCNVVLETVADGTRVAIADPRELMPGEALADLAQEAARKLIDVIAAIDRA